MRYLNLTIAILITSLIIGCAGASSSIEPSKTIAFAEQGHAIAQNNLGSMYQYGDGIPKKLQKSSALVRKISLSRLTVSKSQPWIYV